MKSTGPPSMQSFIERLPPLSPTLTLLLATLSREDVSFAKISEVIEKDPVLAGNVLGLVNSSLYGQSGNVSSIRHAVSLLGVNKLRNAALSMSITRMWDKMRTPPGWSPKRFNKHGLAVAMLADTLSQEAPLIYPEGAFVAGLLHDLGKLMIAVCLPREYAAIETLMVETDRPQV
jgi:HD-like signal output (HDOD) protein